MNPPLRAKPDEACGHLAAPGVVDADEQDFRSLLRHDSLLIATEQKVALGRCRLGAGEGERRALAKPCRVRPGASSPAGARRAPRGPGAFPPSSDSIQPPEDVQAGCRSGGPRRGRSHRRARPACADPTQGRDLPDARAVPPTANAASGRGGSRPWSSSPTPSRAAATSRGLGRLAGGTRAHRSAPAPAIGPTAARFLGRPIAASQEPPPRSTTPTAPVADGSDATAPSQANRPSSSAPSTTTRAESRPEAGPRALRHSRPDARGRSRWSRGARPAPRGLTAIQLHRLRELELRARSCRADTRRRRAAGSQARDGAPRTSPLGLTGATRRRPSSSRCR